MDLDARRGHMGRPALRAELSAMPRQFVHLHCAIKADPRYLLLPLLAQHVYLHLMMEAELTAAGTVRVNLPALATEIPGVSMDEINRSLDELAIAGLVLKDSETFDLWITDYMRRDPGLRNPHWGRAAVRAIQALRSETLAAAILEAAPTHIRKAQQSLVASEQCDPDAIEMPSRCDRDATSIADSVIVHGDGDGQCSVVDRYFKESPVPGMNAKDPDSRLVAERVQGAITELAVRSVADAPANRELLSEVQAKRERHGEMLEKLARDYPDWSVRHLADAIHVGPFGG
jgi:hypothetical protein